MELVLQLNVRLCGGTATVQTAREPAKFHAWDWKMLKGNIKRWAGGRPSLSAAVNVFIILLISAEGFPGEDHQQAPCKGIRLNSR